MTPQRIVGWWRLADSNRFDLFHGLVERDAFEGAAKCGTSREAPCTGQRVGGDFVIIEGRDRERARLTLLGPSIAIPKCRACDALAQEQLDRERSLLRTEAVAELAASSTYQPRANDFDRDEEG